MIGVEIELSIVKIDSKEFPRTTANNSDTLRGGLNSAVFLTDIAHFNWLRGFCSNKHSQTDEISIVNIVQYAKLVTRHILDIDPGRHGLIVVENPNALEGQQNLWYVLPLGFQKVGADGLLIGVHITQDRETGDFNLHSNVIVVRDHIVTGVL